jgi:hypothetical protein
MASYPIRAEWFGWDGAGGGASGGGVKPGDALPGGWTFVSGDASLLAGLDGLVITATRRADDTGWDGEYYFPTTPEFISVNPYENVADYGALEYGDIGQMTSGYAADDAQPWQVYDPAPTTYYLWAFTGSRTAPTAVATKTYVIA